MSQVLATSTQSELQIYLLGTTRILVDGVPIEDRAWTRRKSKALVKLLALAPHHQLHREQLMESLWPEQEPELAANNLNKVLHAARRALEPQLKNGVDSRFLSTHEQQLILHVPGGFWIDVIAFEQQAQVALQGADVFAYETALALYTGTLLEEDRYEDWAVARREQLQRLQQRLLTRTAQLHEASNLPSAETALDKAVECWQHLLSFNATNEEAHRALMRLFARHGSRHQALAQFQKCREVLRKELDAEPERATLTLYNQILADKLNEKPQSDNELENLLEETKDFPDKAPITARQSPPVVTSRGSTRDQKIKRRWQLSALALLLAFLGVGAVYYLRPKVPQTEAIAVLPFINSSRESNLEYLSDGITESLINSLSRLPRLRVLARTTAFRYKGKDFDPIAIGQQLKVRAILTGRVFLRGEELLIQADLIDTATGAQLWGEKYNRHWSDLPAVQTKRQPANTAAFLNYLKGRYYWNQRKVADVRLAIDHFNQALQQDPTYAEAYAGLADAWHTLSGLELPPNEAIPRAREAATKALQLDPQLAAAHASLAIVKWRYDWQFDEAERGFRQAIALDANYAPAHQWLGLLLTYRKRFEEGTRELQQAQQLDPLSSIINANLALPHYFERRYDVAIAQIKRALDLNQSFPYGHFFLGWAYEQKGAHALALAKFQKAVELDKTPSALAYQAHGLASAGKLAEARELFAMLQTLRQERYVSPYHLAVVALGLGDQQQALDWLSRAAEEHADAFVLLSVEPKFDPLRTTPQFVELMRRTGLEQ
jgi:DNA-binding SARP family transcriptional activator/TolB-like protein/Tfp pilus assembly protein PilF